MGGWRLWDARLPTAPELILIAAERAELGRLVRRAHGSQAPVTRAPASVLAGAEPGASNTAVARARVSAGPASARGTPAGTHAELEAASRGYLQETNQQPRPLV